MIVSLMTRHALAPPIIKVASFHTNIYDAKLDHRC